MFKGVYANPLRGMFKHDLPKILWLWWTGTIEFTSVLRSEP